MSDTLVKFKEGLPCKRGETAAKTGCIPHGEPTTRGRMPDAGPIGVDGAQPEEGRVPEPPGGALTRPRHYEPTLTPPMKVAKLPTKTPRALEPLGSSSIPSESSTASAGFATAFYQLGVILAERYLTGEIGVEELVEAFNAVSSPVARKAMGEGYASVGRGMEYESYQRGTNSVERRGVGG